MILCELYWSSLQQEAQQLDLQQSTILEALHVELRQQGLFSVQPRPSTRGYQDTFSVMLQTMVVTDADELTVQHNILTNAPRYHMPSQLSRDLGAATSAGLLRQVHLGNSASISVWRHKNKLTDLVNSTSALFGSPIVDGSPLPTSEEMTA